MHQFRQLRTVFGIAALMLLLSARAASAGEIIVSAAASLTDAFGVIKQKFEAAHPGVTVTTNFNSSGILLKQMENGAPVDVFASADQQTMDQAASKGLITPATRRDFVKNALVLVVPADSKAAVNGEKDLALPVVKRIALGNPDIVPAGRYAREFLELAGLWDSLRPKYIFGNNVRQVLDYVARGEVDAGFVFATDACKAGAKLRVVREAATKTPALYPVAVTAGGKKAEAKAFVDFLLGPEGQRILQSFGFGKP
jgi:molybdate transport system substrate-binding protein